MNTFKRALLPLILFSSGVGLAQGQSSHEFRRLQPGLKVTAVSSAPAPAPTPALTYVASLSASEVNFGDITVGATGTRSVQLNNTGTGPLTINEVTVSGAGYSVSTSCSGSVPAGDSCTASVTFAASTAGASFPGVLSFNTNAAAGVLEVGLTTSVPGDSQASNVTFLLRANGLPWKDLSSLNHTISAAGNASINTSEYKFGGGALNLDGNGDWLTVPSSAGFGFAADDYTVEGWVRVSAAAATDDEWIFDFRQTGGANGERPHLRMSWNGNVIFSVGTSDLISTPRPAHQQWAHFAVSRQAGATRLFINGELRGTASGGRSAGNYGTAAPLTLGTVGDSLGYSTTEFTGQMDEIRVTKGIARYTMSFTTPAAAYPAP